MSQTADDGNLDPTENNQPEEQTVASGPDKGKGKADDNPDTAGSSENQQQAQPFSQDKGKGKADEEPLYPSINIEGQENAPVFGSGGSLKLPKKRAKRTHIMDVHWEKGPETTLDTSSAEAHSDNTQAEGSKISTDPESKPTDPSKSDLNPCAAVFVSPEKSPASSAGSEQGPSKGAAMEHEDMTKSPTRSSETLDFEDERARRPGGQDSIPETPDQKPEGGAGKKKKKKKSKKKKSKAQSGTAAPEAAEAAEQQPPQTATNEDQGQPGLIDDTWPTLPNLDGLSRWELINDAPSAWGPRPLGGPEQRGITNEPSSSAEQDQE